MRSLLLALAAVLLTAGPVLADSSGLVVCGTQEIDKQKTQVIVTENDSSFAASLSAAGFPSPNTAQVGHWTDFAVVLQVHPDKLIAFYDVNIAEQAPSKLLGDFGKKIGVEALAAQCILALEMPLCGERRPCS